jgi:adenosylcobinamide-phosphate synthase
LEIDSLTLPGDPWLVLGAALVEGLTGYPERLHARLPHPVSWIAALIRGFERRLNRADRSGPNRRIGGILTVLLVAGLSGGVGFGLDRLLQPFDWGWAPIILIGSLGMAARSLFDHVRAVDRALAIAGLPAARHAVARIVGRDTRALDQNGVAAAALESLAESFCDGVVAPIFWFLVGGLAGLFVYKAVNTADSLIGHKEAPYRDFGWAAARLDDLMNLVPARIAGAVIALAALRGWKVMWRDAKKHASPNAGWPEAAMAGALGVRLGGPAWYDGLLHPRAVIGDGPPPRPEDLQRGLRLYMRACAVLVLLLALGSLAWPR